MRGQLTARLGLFRVLIGSSLIAISAPHIAGQSQTTSTESEIWPEVDAHIQLPGHFRVLAFSGVQEGVNYPYRQWYAAAGIGYRFKAITRPHLKNIDPDKEYSFVFGGGYEFLRTIQLGKEKEEDRMIWEAIFGHRFPADFLVRDRNQGEFRWVNGTYSTTYRNMLSVEHDFLVGRFRFTPYGSAEIFYDGSQHSWDEEWYTAGVQWPYRRLLMLDTYYRRENCSTCTPRNWNVGGVTVNVYLRNKK